MLPIMALFSRTKSFNGSVIRNRPLTPAEHDETHESILLLANGLTEQQVRDIAQAEATDVTIRALDTDPNNDPEGLSLPDPVLVFENALI